MENSDYVYTPPRVASTREIPTSIKNLLNGEDLLAKQQALRLATVNHDGWPNAATLSAGEMLVTPNGRVRFVISPRSGTAANLMRDGRMTLSLALDGGICEMRLRARKYSDGTPEVPLAFFEAEVEQVRQHSAGYAKVTGGITFSLNDSATEQSRWQRQITALLVNGG
jgi:hypothetical protein